MSSRRSVLVASERAPGRPLGDGVEDQLPVAFDRLGELDEWVEVAALRPGEPADEQLRGGTGRRAPSLDHDQAPTGTSVAPLTGSALA